LYSVGIITITVCDDLPLDSDAVAISKTIIVLAKNMNMKLIVKGVETQEQQEFLISQRCYNIQGYFYSEPLNVKDITKFFIFASHQV